MQKKGNFLTQVKSGFTKEKRLSMVLRLEENLIKKRRVSQIFAEAVN